MLNATKPRSAARRMATVESVESCEAYFSKPFSVSRGCAFPCPSVVIISTRLPPATWKNDIIRDMEKELIYKEESYAIRGALFEVYKTLGPGFLEEVYQHALEEELKLRHIPFKAQPQLHIMYKGKDCGLYQPDFICYDKIIVELKAVEEIHPKHIAQTMNYLKATNFKLGILVNFCAYPQVYTKRIAL